MNIEFNWKAFRNDLWKKMKYAEWKYYTQKTKANKLGISQSKLSRLETGNGSFKLSVDEFAKACEVMNTNPVKYFRINE